ncbi:hypothetical protein LOK49_LG01G01812 [Camellia lanceoleosa]|uniref:Uncharacterized protein n=1 Tax=Camellia lanceoleosa TaxID=1840588 RepID=A0ACC0IXS6_9ERIC|nr:hypothetical protein LOK49_LG01G01812 [Camellia lanceoleosa]
MKDAFLPVKASIKDSGVGLAIVKAIMLPLDNEAFHAEDDATMIAFAAQSEFWLPKGSPISGVDIRFLIVEPDPGHTKLHISKEGLEAIQRIITPIAAVAAIGPYRSGKSFLLNQLLSLSCYERLPLMPLVEIGLKRFGVGHMRDTKTKGRWRYDHDTSVFYLDTEEFESIGKSNVYNDRIEFGAHL